ncbi:hypothetical protein [Phytohabitans kaempferiae]|uniref:Uncharacterized protein n=1 Tax=Phytohabitans kaempferiae TaxID=1620943 RepID=A0ABV6MAB2_9ACTN
MTLDSRGVGFVLVTRGAGFVVTGEGEGETPGGELVAPGTTVVSSDTDEPGTEGGVAGLVAAGGAASGSGLSPLTNAPIAPMPQHSQAATPTTMPPMASGCSRLRGGDG